VTLTATPALRCPNWAEQPINAISAEGVLHA